MYTYFIPLDQVVMQALTKASRDHSILMAAALKEQVTEKSNVDRERVTEEIDSGRISRQVIEREL